MSQNSTAGSLSASLPLDMTTEDPVPSTSKAVHRFFEPIILFTALVAAVKHTAKPPNPEPNIDVNDYKQLFCAVISKVCHVCDKEKGGCTVTSFVALPDKNDPRKAKFVFAANRQTDSELRITEAYVKALFRKINQASEGDKNHEARGALLYHILRFNRPRVSFYLRNLRSQAEKCLESCQSTNPNEDDAIAAELKKILISSPTGSELSDPEIDYMHKSEATIQLLIRIEKSPAGAAIKSRALEDRIPGFTSMECWSRFFHTMNRILAYPQSAKFFLCAKRVWPSLFDNPDVGFLSSSRPMEKPARQKSQKADGIVGRMTGNPEYIELYRNFAKNLQAFDLDARIQAEYKKKSFKPIAHAEVILLNWLLKPGEVAPEKFFNGWAYIGSSKPTCKLCDYYFQEHESNVEHRISHGNFYPSWRVPDVFPYQGEEAKRQRQHMVNRILGRVRKDTFDIVEAKASPTTKMADSNTFTARMTLYTDEIRCVRGSEAEVDDIAAMMGGVSLNF